MSVSRQPPGPTPPPLTGFLPALRRDPLGFVTRMAREYGDIVRVPLRRTPFIFVNHPDYIEHVLVVQQRRFVKGGLSLNAGRRLLGRGLLTSEGDLWRRQHGLILPGFHRQTVGRYAPTMVDQTLRHAAGWRDGQTLDVVNEMKRLAIAIDMKTLLGADPGMETHTVADALTVLARHVVAQTRAVVPVPERWPTPGNRRAARAYRQLDDVVYGLIRERRTGGEDRGDLLSMMVHVHDEDGSRMSLQQLRDETMTLLLTGHETTALTLVWTWYLLATHPAAESRLHEEIRQVLDGAPPTLDLVRQMPYLDAVLAESLRLYPPGWSIGRTSVEAFELGGYQFPARTTVSMFQWVMHRDPRYFEAPDEFQPQRWLDGLAERIPTYAYFPFGGGPRRCIGQSFALTEAALVLATIAQRYRLELLDDPPVVPEPVITLQPKYGMRMKVRDKGSGIRD